MNILVINGPNLNLLGIREPDLYGKEDYAALVALVEDTCAQEGIGVEVFQSHTHPSEAIPDAPTAVQSPAVEVHISDVSKREDFRQVSYARLACLKTYMGLGLDGYRQGILYLKEYLSSHR